MLAEEQIAVPEGVGRNLHTVTANVLAVVSTCESHPSPHGVGRLQKELVLELVVSLFANQIYTVPSSTHRKCNAHTLNHIEPFLAG